jgi:adenosine deaminase
LANEYRLAAENFHFAEEDFIQLNRNAVAGSFLPEEEKSGLLAQIDAASHRRSKN